MLNTGVHPVGEESLVYSEKLVLEFLVDINDESAVVPKVISSLYVSETTTSAVAPLVPKETKSYYVSESYPSIPKYHAS